jgi:hypothetical protein
MTQASFYKYFVPNGTGCASANLAQKQEAANLFRELQSGTDLFKTETHPTVSSILAGNTLRRACGKQLETGFWRPNKALLMERLQKLRLAGHTGQESIYGFSK